MPKTERVEIRMTKEFRAKCVQYCKDRSVTMTDAITACLTDALTLAGYFDKGGK